MNKLSILLFVIVIATEIHIGIGIKCYVCNSGSDYQGSKCNSPESDLIMDCDNLPEDIGRAKLNYTVCRKFVQDVDGDIRVVRSCATRGRVGRCIDRTGTAKIKLQYCECANSDPNQPCNESPNAIGITRLAVFFFAATALISSLILH